MSFALTGAGPVTCSYADDLGLIYVAQQRVMTVITVPGARVASATLGFTPERFVPCEAGVYAVGLEGWALFSGDHLVSESLAFGPHRILGGRPRPVTGVPDFGGLPVDPATLERHWGDPVTACLYRGELMVAYRGGTALSSCGGRVSPSRYVSPEVSSRFYVHPVRNFLALSVPRGLLYSVDHGLGWHVKPTGEWPVYLAGQTWAAQEGVIRREP